MPLLPGYRWHWVAQVWRRRPFGEIANATTTRASMALTMRQARGDRSAMPPEFVALVLWGDRDPYLPTRFAEGYVDAFPDAELEVLEGAGHRPWIDHPAAIGRVTSFASG